MASWTSKDALVRDLARAQGGAPIAITDPLLFHETPREYEEEKEVEYQFRDASAATDFSEGPDLQMIMQMLEIVNDYDVTPESQTVEISKLNPLCEGFVPKSSENTSCISEQKSTVKKKNRNAAIESILKAQKESTSNLSETSKYIPPHLRNKLQSEEAKQNVTTKKKQNGLKPIIYNSSMASSMFKKKTVSNMSNKSPDTIKVPVEILKTNTFVPSNVASSYYEKFVEFNEAKKVKNDIWAVIQKKMTEFEEKKHREAELTLSDTETSKEVSSPPLVQESSNEEQALSKQD